MRKEILDLYRVEDGIILNPGKFEGCSLYAPYFRHLTLNGGGDEVCFDRDTQYDLFFITEEHLVAFPELEGIDVLVVWEDDQGFFRSNAASYAEADRFMRRLAAEWEDEDEIY